MNLSLKAKDLLSRIDLMGGVTSFKASTDKHNAWNAAYELYKKENPYSKIRLGCSSCKTKVYYWLKKNAK